MALGADGEPGKGPWAREGCNCASDQLLKCVCFCYTQRGNQLHESTSHGTPSRGRRECLDSG